MTIKEYRETYTICGALNSFDIIKGYPLPLLLQIQFRDLSSALDQWVKDNYPG